MSEAAFRSCIGTLATSVGALAAIGAALRLRRDGATAPADVQRRLDEVLAALTRALSFVRLVRGGGEIRAPAELLTAAGFEAVEIAPMGLLTFVLCRRR